MDDRFPGYDVLTKRGGLSWNPQTRTVIADRLALDAPDGLLDDDMRGTLGAIIDRIVPQPPGRPAVNTLAILLDGLARGAGDGYRHASLPPAREAWGRGLGAIDEEAKGRFARRFARLGGQDADILLAAIERGDAHDEAWGGMPPAVFWGWRLLPDIVSAYYAHPSAWSAMGFGGPAAPRGYVRLRANRRDPWEAAEGGDGRIVPASARNRHVE